MDAPTWLEKAHARVISNTIAKLRILRQQQDADSTLEAIRYLERSAIDVESESDPKSLLPQHKREESELRYPLGWLSATAETIEADLESKWRSALRLKIADASNSKTERFASVTSVDGPATVYYRPQWSLSGRPATSEHAGQSAPRKRPRESPAEATTYGASQWLRGLPTIGAIQFAMGCILQSEAIQRDNRALSISYAAGCGKCDDMGSEPERSESIKALLGHLEFAATQCAPESEREPPTLGGTFVGSSVSTVATSLSSANVDAPIAFPTPADFNWVTSAVQNSGAHDDVELFSYLAPSDDAFDSIPCNAIVYASFDVSRTIPGKHLWSRLPSKESPSIRVPRELSKGTGLLRGRGEFAVSKVKWN